MQKLMERLDRQDELLLAMKAEGKQPTITESIRLFDNQDLCMLLQISKRTLQRYRSVGALPYNCLLYTSLWILFWIQWRTSVYTFMPLPVFFCGLSCCCCWRASFGVV